LKMQLRRSTSLRNNLTSAQLLRGLDSIQLTATHKVATPVNWKHGEDVIIAPAVSDEEAKQKYPDGWKAPKPYLRIVPQPK
jgi:thioredoxin-dependent peroxiredoxin